MISSPNCHIAQNQNLTNILTSYFYQSQVLFCKCCEIILWGGGGFRCLYCLYIQEEYPSSFPWFILLFLFWQSPFLKINSVQTIFIKVYDTPKPADLYAIYLCLLTFCQAKFPALHCLNEIQYFVRVRVGFIFKSLQKLRFYQLCMYNIYIKHCRKNQVFLSLPHSLPTS